MHANPSASIACFPYLTEAACDAIVDDLDAGGWVHGRIAKPVGSDGVDEHAVRKCSLNRCLDETLLQRLERDLRALNTELFCFDVTGFNEDDPTSGLSSLDAVWIVAWEQTVFQGFLRFTDA